MSARLATGQIRSNNPRLERRLFIYAPLAFAMLFLVGPFYWMAITALKPDSELYDGAKSPLYVATPSLDHFRFIFEKTDFVTWTMNTMMVATLSTIIALAMGIPAGYALARLRFRGSELIGTAIFVTYLVPSSLLFIPMVEVMAQFHLDDSIWALVVVYPTFLVPFVTWLMSGYFRTIPTELEDCARIDGMTRFGAMLRIAIPLARPGILSAGIFAFTLSWNEFIYALAFISSTEKKTVPVAVLTELVQGDVYHWGSLMTGALLGSLPVAIFYMFFVEYYVSSLTGAVKE